MTPLLHLQQYPHLYEAIMKHDILSSCRTDAELTPDSSPEISYMPPQLSSHMTSSIELTHPNLTQAMRPVVRANEGNKSLSLGSIICNIFCRCLRRKKVQPSQAKTEEITTKLVQKKALTVDMGVLAQEKTDVSIHAVPKQRASDEFHQFTLGPSLEESHFSSASSETAYNYSSPRVLAKTPIDDVIRARSQTEPVDLSVLTQVLFWRQSMIKDTILPSIPVCEVIIKDNNFHELLILKNLFSKPENFEKWSRLKPCFQRVIIEVQSGRQSPVLDMLQSNIVSKPLRPVRAQTDPTLVRL